MKTLKLLAIAGLLSGCVASEYNAPPTEWMDINLRTPYALITSSEVARVGETSQRFELRHGSCRGYDCDNDRQRFELIQSRGSENTVGDKTWYGFSMYLPNDFQEISPSNTTVGQVKLTRWRGPLWNLNLRNGRMIFEYRPNGQHDSVTCHVANLSQMRGRWTDLVIYSDYNTRNTQNNAMLTVWANGRQVCNSNQLLVTTAMVSEVNHTDITLRYGIYNSYVSRWLNANRTRSVNTTGFSDLHTQNGGVSQSEANRPFEIDWGVELPTQIIFYDEVRIGRSREQVDVRMRD